MLPLPDRIRVTVPDVPSTAPLHASASALLREAVTLVRALSCKASLDAARPLRKRGSAAMTWTPIAAPEALADSTSASWWPDNCLSGRNWRNNGSCAPAGVQNAQTQIIDAKRRV